MNFTDQHCGTTTVIGVSGLPDLRKGWEVGYIWSPPNIAAIRGITLPIAGGLSSGLDFPQNDTFLLPRRIFILWKWKFKTLSCEHFFFPKIKFKGIHGHFRVSDTMKNKTICCQPPWDSYFKHLVHAPLSLLAKLELPLHEIWHSALITVPTAINPNPLSVFPSPSLMKTTLFWFPIGFTQWEAPTEEQREGSWFQEDKLGACFFCSFPQGSRQTSPGPVSPSRTGSPGLFPVLLRFWSYNWGLFSRRCGLLTFSSRGLLPPLLIPASATLS